MPSQNICYSHSSNFHLSGSTESVTKQPTQLIIAAYNCHTKYYDNKTGI